MSGEILADGNSPMVMTVDQYNAAVARTWNLAVEETISAERSRIIAYLERESACSVERGHDYNGSCYCEIVMRISNGEAK